MTLDLSLQATLCLYCPSCGDPFTLLTNLPIGGWAFRIGSFEADATGELRTWLFLHQAHGLPIPVFVPQGVQG